MKDSKMSNTLRKWAIQYSDGFWRQSTLVRAANRLDLQDELLWLYRELRICHSEYRAQLVRDDIALLETKLKEG